jgi:hypothetical protein
LSRTSIVQLITFLALVLTLSLVIPKVYSAAPDSSAASSDPDFCLKNKGKQARAQSQKELDSIPTPEQCLASQNNGASPPSTTTTPSSETEYTTMPGCGKRLVPKQMIPQLLAFRQQLKEGKLAWACDAQGNVILTSHPTPKVTVQSVSTPEVTVQSVLESLGKRPPTSDEYGWWFHSGYEYGIISARMGNPAPFHAAAHLPNSSALSNKGFDDGYSQGYDAYVVIKRLEAYRNLER